MSGVAIEYLLGLFFFVSSLSWQPQPGNGAIRVDVVKLIAGILLIVMAMVGFSLVR